MLFMGFVGVVGLLAALGLLTSGRLTIEDVCDLNRKTQPVIFFLVVGVVTLISAALVLACAVAFQEIYSAAAP